MDDILAKINPDYPPGKIIKEGWMYKRGEHVRNWKRKYFYLIDNACLIGFKEKPDTASMPSTNIRLKRSQIILIDKPVPFTFIINTRHSDDVIKRMFHTDCHEERQLWTAAIKRIADTVPNEWEDANCENFAENDVDY